MTARPENGPPPPYVGLRPFEFHEAALFYGRGEHIAEMVRTLRKGHFLAVVGSSGSGKSSLVRAGLLPAVAAGFMDGGEEAADWRFVIMRPGQEPYENLLRELLPQLAPGQSLDPATVEFRRQTLRGGPRGLVEAVADSLLPENARLVVLVDQFEEIFRSLERGGPSQPDDGSSLANRRNAALAFVDMLLATAEERDPRVYVVLTMRSEYLGECEAFLDLSAAIAKSQFLTPRMTREQVQDIIERPIQAVGGRIEPQVVMDLLNSLGTAQDQLPRVEHLLLWMWNRVRETRKDQPVSLTLDGYREAGRFESALDRHAEQLFGELAPGATPGQPSEKQRVAQHLFRSLAVRSSQGTLVRRWCSLGEVASIAGASEQIVAEVVEHFRQPGCNFLVATPSAPLTGKTTLDISHEALLRQWARLRSWLDEEAKSAEIYGRVAEAAVRHAAGEASLWRDPDLQLALNWRKRNQPTLPWAQRYHPGFDGAMHFLKQSQKQRKVRRGLSYAMIVVLAVLCVVSWILKNKAQRAEEQAKNAEAMANDRERTARSAALRVRKQNRDSYKLIESMASRLAELTALQDAPQEATIWQRNRAYALEQLRQYDEAIHVYETLLKTDPQNAAAHSSLGYLYILVGKPTEALDHTVIALKQDSNKWTDYQNQAIALGALGFYDEAANALGTSMEKFQHSLFELGETETDPEIKHATGHTMLVSDERGYRAVLPYALANLEAFRGGDGFEQTVREVTTQQLPPEAYLVLVNWVWYHFKNQPKDRPKDYGGFAAQGIWWKHAGFAPFAKQAYEKFESEHRHRQIDDARYTKLAAWVSARLQELKDEKLPEAREDDAQTLAFEALEHEDRGEFDKAEEKLRSAIKKDPDNVAFELQRVSLSLLRAWKCIETGDKAGAANYFGSARGECNVVLKAYPNTAVAYRYRALANQGLKRSEDQIEADFSKTIEPNPSDSKGTQWLSNASKGNRLDQRLKALDDAIKADFEHAIAYDPSDGESMLDLSDSIEAEDRNKAMELRKKGLAATVGYQTLPFMHSGIAKLEKSNGKFREALKSIDTAISIKADEIEFYELRYEIERAYKPPKSESEVTKNLAAGYTKVAIARLRAGATAEAIDLYWKAVEKLAKIRDVKNERELAGQFEKPITGISDTIEGAAISAGIDRTASKAKAVEFWKTAIESKQWPDMRKLFDKELKRLENPH